MDFGSAIGLHRLFKAWIIILTWNGQWTENTERYTEEIRPPENKIFIEMAFLKVSAGLIAILGLCWETKGLKIMKITTTGSKIANSRRALSGNAWQHWLADKQALMRSCSWRLVAPFLCWLECRSESTGMPFRVISYKRDGTMKG